MSDVAWHSRVTMHEAKWTDIDGSTVTFKLPMDEASERKRNPFQQFTKRRKGKAGTRFMMVCVSQRGGIHSVYENEVMLAGWNDSQSNGHTVKFWLCDDAMGHPFDGYDRKQDEFVISLVELDDDNAPIDQNVRERVERQSTSPSQRPSYGAVMLCKNEGFWNYIGQGADADPEERSREFICGKLGIKSRAELDKSEALRERYHHEIWKPFTVWQGKPF